MRVETYTCFQQGCDHPVPGATGPLAACGCCMWFAWPLSGVSWKRYWHSFPIECRTMLREDGAA